MGLFVESDLLSGVTICTFTAPNLKKHRRNAPHDSGVEVNSRKLWDQAIVSRITMPTNSWYRMNHSKTPNVRMCSYGGSVKFISMRVIYKGEELVYDYDPGHLVEFYNK